MSIECYDSNCSLHDPSTPYCTQLVCVKECPMCNKSDYIPDNIYHDVYHLGSGSVEFNCLHCNSSLEVDMRRRVIVQILSIRCV